MVALGAVGGRHGAAAAADAAAAAADSWDAEMHVLGGWGFLDIWSAVKCL